MKFRIARLFAAACLALLGAAAAQAQTKLLFSTFFPPTHPIVRGVMQPWADDVKAATKGEVVIEFSPTSLAPPPGQLDMVANGVADVTLQFSGVVPNRLTAMLVTEMPGPVSTSEAMSLALWRTYGKYFAKADEHKPLKVLSAVVFPPQGFFGVRDEPFTKIEQFRGAKIATTPGTVGRIFGAVTPGVIAGPAVRYFELVSKGTVDAYASVTALDVIGFNLGRHTKTSTRLNDLMGAASFSLVMNQAKWAALTPQQQEAITALSGEAFGRRMAVLDEADRKATETLRSSGVKFVDAPPELRQELARAFAFAEKEWVEQVGKRGVDGKAAIAFYRGEHLRLAGSR